MLSREAEEDGVETLNFHTATPYHLKRENLGLATKYEERMEMGDYRTYQKKEIEYWQVKRK